MSQAAVAPTPAADVDYDALSADYARRRVPDPRIESAIGAALGDARRIVNIGAGAGSYEPRGRDVVAVDASRGMLARREGAAPAVQARAERLPFADDAFDAALAVLTLHHWSDQAEGLREARRVAKSRVVLLTWTGFPEGFWLADYIPGIDADHHLFPSVARLERSLGAVTTRPVPIPRDCTDGFLCAYWARPEQYLDPLARRAISTFARIPEPVAGLERLAADLRSGRWHDRYGECLARDSGDFGYRLVVAEQL